LDAKSVKEYIIKNDLLIDLLTKIGCHSFTWYSKEMRCALPNDDDNSKVSIFLNEELSVRIFTKGETIYGSIFDLIMYIDGSSFPEAFKKCTNLLGLSNVNIKVVKKDSPLDFFKKIKRNKLQATQNQQYYDRSILDKYSTVPHIDLIKDGILFDVIEKYDIRFDPNSDRIVFPHFKYDDKNKIVGLIGRTVIKAYKELNIPKYFSMEGIKYEKSKNLYGLSHNIENIKKYGLIIVFESEKSVLKSDMYGLPIGVAVGCHDLSAFQKKLLISLDVEIVIAFDKDVEENHVINLCKQLSPYRKVSYISDRWDLLNEKDSPADRGIKKFNFLMKHRVYV
jgi:DNA primase